MNLKNNLPIWQLTVGEFIHLLKENGVGATVVTEKQPQQPNKSYVYGIGGLARLLNCSNVTAQKIKNSGKIDFCYSQAGRKLVFDTDLVLTTLKKGGDNYAK